VIHFVSYQLTALEKLTVFNQLYFGGVTSRMPHITSFLFFPSKYLKFIKKKTFEKKSKLLKKKGGGGGGKCIFNHEVSVLFQC
jgi:hypothetical protein